MDLPKIQILQVLDLKTDQDRIEAACQHFLAAWDEDYLCGLNQYDID